LQIFLDQAMKTYIEYPRMKLLITDRARINSRIVSHIKSDSYLEDQSSAVNEIVEETKQDLVR
jgi:hypothetical protein